MVHALFYVRMQKRMSAFLQYLESRNNDVSINHGAHTNYKLDG